MYKRWVKFDSAALGDTHWEIIELEGTDELNRLFRFEVKLICRDEYGRHVEADELLETAATLRFIDQDQEVARVHGIVAQLSHSIDPHHDWGVLELTVVPRTWLMTQRRGNEVFLERSIPEVLVEKLERIGLREGDDYVLALRDDYPQREIIVQYDETDYDFFSRLCEHLGIATLFSHDEGRDVLILTDRQEYFRQIPGANGILPVGPERRHPCAYDVRAEVRRRPEQAIVHDYNYRSPRLKLDRFSRTDARVKKGDWVEFGEHTKTPDETERLAQIRSQQLTVNHKTITGKSSEMTLHAGGTFSLSGAVVTEEELLATKVIHRARMKGSDQEDPETLWDNEFVAIPRSVVYRPERRTPKPQVAGLLNAVVDGAIKGPYAELDEQGRYHVSMELDRSGRTDLTASHPVRMMQPHAGAYYGMHFPLRPGTEVLIGCVNGDPDRPIIVGSSPNPVIANPVIRANQTQNVLRTGSNNEMVIEDRHGIERIRIHTPQNNTTIQLGSIEEPEEGALTRTEASISEASRISNNEATAMKTLMAQTATSLLGQSAVVLAGFDGLANACSRGIDIPSAVRTGEIFSDLRALSTPPVTEEDKAKEGEEGEQEAQPDDAEQDTAEASEQETNAPSDERAFDGGPGDEGRETPGHDGATGGGGPWSALASSLAESADSSAMDAVRAMAEASDKSLADAKGREQGQPLGQPITPGALIGGLNTASLFSRDRSMVWGDRVAALSSNDTASVAGRKMAEVRSPHTVEVAGADKVYVSTAGLFDVAANRIRMVGGYYPEHDPEPLEEGTTIGIMARRDIKILSAEHCILICAHKNLIAAAHTGDMKLKAKNTISMKATKITGEADQVIINAGSVYIGAGDVTVKAKNVTVDAEEKVTITAGSSVDINAGSINLNGNVYISGTLDQDLEAKLAKK